MRIKIDGKTVSARNGDTILDVANRAGIFIPTLCHDEKLEPYASCWTCAVKVVGEKRLKPACSTKVEDGMEITTEDEEIRVTRKTCLELILSDHCGECLPPCQLACPAGCDARGYTNLILNKRYDEAYRLIMETIPLPATIGRICPHPCEDECRRDVVDKPVSICALKRFVAAQDTPKKLPRKKRPTGKRIAIIGSGPAGLTAAYFLALAGHEVTIFEARVKAGGMLRYGIPEYRLPKDILDSEIETIQKLGVVIKYGVSIGDKDIILNLISKGHNVVLIAVGAQLNRKMKIDGEEVERVLNGINFLAGVASGKRPNLGKTVFVIGGGDTAIDAARTALRLGAEDVSIIYRRSREEMPASLAEIAAAEAEGIKIDFLTLPLKIQRDHNRLNVTCSRMALGEPDSSGRRKPIPIPGSEYETACDSLIMAIGQSVDTSVLNKSGLEPTSKGRISARDETLETANEAVFAAGDCITGPDIAIGAIAAGRKAAYSINSYLRTGKASPLPGLFSPAQRAKEEVEAEEYADTERIERAVAGELHVEERIRGFPEVEKTFDEETALREAYRCLDCGCEKVKDCTLLNLSGRYGVELNRFGSPEKRYRIDDRHRYIVRDPDKCIKCARCIRVCLEVQGIAAWCDVGRGFDMQVAPPFGQPLQDTDCESCGQCLTACPTAALTEKTALPKALSILAETTDTTCAHCGIGCQIGVHTFGNTITKVTPKDNGNLCEKGKFEFDYLNDKRRIIFPMVKRGKRLVHVNWKEAGQNFRGATGEISGKKLAVFISARLTNEEAYAAQKLARTVLKTNNIYPLGGTSFSRKIHERILPAVSSNAIEDIERSGAILLVGAYTIQHNEVAALPIIKAVRNGARLLILGRQKTKLDKLAFRKIKTDPEKISQNLKEISDFFKNSKNPTVVYNRNCINGQSLHLLSGLAKSDHLKTVSLCTEINEQGLLEAGVSPFMLPGKISITDRTGREKLAKRWKGRIPAWSGLDRGKMIQAMKRGKIKAALFIGDSRLEDKDIIKALRRVSFVATQAIIPSHLTRLANLVLPAASWTETAGSFTRYDGKTLTLRQALPPLCGYSNVEIWQQLIS